MSDINIGDKVYLRNTINETGKVVKIDSASKYATVKTEEGDVCYPFELLQKLD